MNLYFWLQHRGPRCAPVNAPHQVAAHLRRRSRRNNCRDCLGHVRVVPRTCEGRDRDDDRERNGTNDNPMRVADVVAHVVALVCIQFVLIGHDRRLGADLEKTTYATEYELARSEISLLNIFSTFADNTRAT